MTASGGHRRGGGCPDRHDALSAFVDGALGDPDRQRLLAHLSDCPGCREELDELRRLQDRVRSSAPDPAAPRDLADRLTAIAGDGHATPLYARPFDAGRSRAPRGGTRLPSRRRRVRVLALGTVAGSCLGLVGAVGVGWVAAPPTHTPAIDPTSTARREFAAVLADDGIGNRAVAAVRGTDRGGPRVESAVAPPVPTVLVPGPEARQWLQRADSAGTATPISGTQQVQVRHLNGYWVASAQVVTDPATGTRVLAAGSDKQTAQSWWPAPGATPGATAAELAAAHHELATAPGPVIAGHDSQVVEARNESGRVVARWWLDRQTAVVLWQQTFDERGQTVLSAGFSRVRIGAGAASGGVQALAAQDTLTLSGTGPAQARVLTQQGWSCSDRLAGLDLVQVRRGEIDNAAGGGEETLHTVYGDGVTTLSVIQQRGALGGAPEGFVWDPQLRAYRSLGITTTLLWQSGDTVITVVTDGSEEVAATAVASLPHDPPVLRTRTQRVVDGWQRILGGG
ncbi:zf-HC2 domain-containing protein [Enemella evansiae]|uniref:Putative zinc-finger domain-containing protein n=1 Tax=Enemella evansiae TaxID=2016499 RepID=A0A255G9P9_9ACTN|nr:zf-HC2 domain-containing protein [Enemella evansiae]OYN95700.1 hypothetical protein CGZ96_14455 [Enemella evansiae]OYO12638.1 hypothetical protein CGZ94_12035 [Enemella evansiae]TDO86240.1 putative zinc finger protein [Enemella evansiae]